jgi:hypothetical protein
MAFLFTNHNARGEIYLLNLPSEADEILDVSESDLKTILE